jgi:ATP-dependent Clp protease ATP-binding subunit ClpA
MFERFTPSARAVVITAQQHARRLGHRYVGCEHLLLAAVSGGEPASAVLREYGITPERVEEEIVQQIGLGAGSDLFRGLDSEALASIGVDLDAVRARIEATFGRAALARADQVSAGRGSIWARVRRSLRRRSRRGTGAAEHLGAGRWRVATGAHPGAETGQVAAGPLVEEATGRYRVAVPSEGHLPFTPRAKKILTDSLREEQARGDSEISALHLVLALVTMKRGMAPEILSALGSSGPSLRAAVLDRYRQAG